MADLTLKDIPEDILELLRKKAALEDKSLSEETLDIVIKDLQSMRKRVERFQAIFEKIEQMSGDRFRDAPSPEDLVGEDREIR